MEQPKGIERQQTGTEGIFIVKGVPVIEAAEDTDCDTLHFTGVKRGSGGFAVRAFKMSDQSTKARLKVTDDFSSDHPDFLGELHVYGTTSPIVPVAERSVVPENLPEPLSLSDYEAFIDIEDGEALARGRAAIDILIVLITPEERTISSDRFQFTGLSLRLSKKVKSHKNKRTEEER